MRGIRAHLFSSGAPMSSPPPGGCRFGQGSAGAANQASRSTLAFAQGQSEILTDIAPYMRHRTIELIQPFPLQQTSVRTVRAEAFLMDSFFTGWISPLRAQDLKKKESGRTRRDFSEKMDVISIGPPRLVRIEKRRDAKQQSEDGGQGTEYREASGRRVDDFLVVELQHGDGGGRRGGRRRRNVAS
jgi:hypothetical protein